MPISSASEIVSFVSTDVADTIENKLRKASYLLIMSDEKTTENPLIKQFLDEQRHFDVAPSEILPAYFRKQETSDAYRRAMVLGCIDCLTEFKQKITNEESFSNDDLTINKAKLALRDVVLVLWQFAEARPDLVACTVSPTVHDLLDLCLNKDTAKTARGPVMEMATDLDRYLPWDEARQNRWIALMGQPTIPHYAFKHIVKCDPFNPALEKALPELLVRKLTGKETFSIPHLLSNLLKSRKGDETVLARSFDQIPEELHPKLRVELDKHPFSRRWADLIAVRKVENTASIKTDPLTPT